MQLLPQTSVIFTMWLNKHNLPLCRSPRCMVEGPCSIPLEHNMKENSKTTCTTAQEHTPSQMVLCVKVTFIITGKKNAFLKIFSGKKNQINIKDNYYMRVFILKDTNMSFGSLHRRCN